MRSKTRWILVAVLLVPFLGIVLALHFALPGLRDWSARRPLGAAGRELLREELGSVVLYRSPSLDAEACRRLARALDEFTHRLVDAYGDFFGLRAVSPPVTLQLFETVEELERAHRGRYRRDFANLGGFYDVGERLVALPAGGRLDGRLEPLLHEATHLVFDVSRKGRTSLPLWLEEGLATYFGASRLDAPGGAVIGGADPVLRHVAAAAEASGELPSIGELLSADPARFRGEENRVFYAASHALVAFLMDGDGGAHREGFRRYFEDVRRIGTPDPGLLYWKLREDPGDLERTWRRYVASAAEGR
jgi:hypothetical protein